MTTTFTMRGAKTHTSGKVVPENVPGLLVFTKEGLEVFAMKDGEKQRRIISVEKMLGHLARAGEATVCARWESDPQARTLRLNDLNNLTGSKLMGVEWVMGQRKIFSPISTVAQMVFGVAPKYIVATLREGDEWPIISVEQAQEMLGQEGTELYPALNYKPNQKGYPTTEWVSGNEKRPYRAFVEEDSPRLDVGTAYTDPQGKVWRLQDANRSANEVRTYSPSFIGTNGGYLVVRRINQLRTAVIGFVPIKTLVTWVNEGAIVPAPVMRSNGTSAFLPTREYVQKRRAASTIPAQEERQMAEELYIASRESFNDVPF